MSEERLEKVRKASTLVLYHANCTDGFAAAWVAHTWFGPGADVAYWSINYGQAVPETEAKHIMILDFCLPRETLLALAERCKVTVLDHHKTSRDALEGLQHPNIHAVFDMQRSGARLAYDHFSAMVADPEHQEQLAACEGLVNYVQDRDLWNKMLPHTEEVTAYLFTLPWTFEAFTRAAEMPLEDIIVAGRACNALLAKQVQSSVRFALKKRIKIGDTWVRSANVYASQVSDTLHILAETDLHADFAAGWSVNSEGQVLVSLRAARGFDASAVALQYGGGGHAAACGFRTTLAWLAETIANARTDEELGFSE